MKNAKQLFFFALGLSLLAGAAPVYAQSFSTDTTLSTKSSAEIVLSEVSVLPDQVSFELTLAGDNPQLDTVCAASFVNGLDSDRAESTAQLCGQVKQSFTFNHTNIPEDAKIIKTVFLYGYSYFETQASNYPYKTWYSPGRGSTGYTFYGKDGASLLLDGDKEYFSSWAAGPRTKNRVALHLLSMEESIQRLHFNLAAEVDYINAYLSYPPIDPDTPFSKEPQSIYLNGNNIGGGGGFRNIDELAELGLSEDPNLPENARNRATTAYYYDDESFLTWNYDSPGSGKALKLVYGFPEVLIFYRIGETQDGIWQGTIYNNMTYEFNPSL